MNPMGNYLDVMAGLLAPLSAIRSHQQALSERVAASPHFLHLCFGHLEESPCTIEDLFPSFKSIVRILQQWLPMLAPQAPRTASTLLNFCPFIPQPPPQAAATLPLNRMEKLSCLRPKKDLHPLLTYRALLLPMTMIGNIRILQG